MPIVKDVLDYLCLLAPIESMESWDNTGLLAGRQGANVTGILLALDITPEVVEEALDMKLNLIVSHHPIIIYDMLSAVTDADPRGRLILSLIEGGISAICMHTNLDKAPGGVDEALARRLGFNNPAPLTDEGVGLIGELPEAMPLLSFLRHVKQTLGANGLKYYSSGKDVKKVATGCGSCSEYIEQAINTGCDTFLTSDIKYDRYLTAKAAGINLIDAGHFPTENVIIPIWAEKLADRFPGLNVVQSSALAQPDEFYI